MDGKRKHFSSRQEQTKAIQKASIYQCTANDWRCLVMKESYAIIPSQLREMRLNW